MGRIHTLKPNLNEKTTTDSTRCGGVRGKNISMALRTDDCDIRDVHLYMEHGGNGDYYITLTEFPMPDSKKHAASINYRMAMSGGETSHHHEVRMAFVALYRAMEKAGLNERP